MLSPATELEFAKTDLAMGRPVNVERLIAAAEALCEEIEVAEEERDLAQKAAADAEEELKQQTAKKEIPEGMRQLAGELVELLTSGRLTKAVRDRLAYNARFVLHKLEESQK